MPVFIVYSIQYMHRALYAFNVCESCPNCHVWNIFGTENLPQFTHTSQRELWGVTQRNAWGTDHISVWLCVPCLFCLRALQTLVNFGYGRVPLSPPPPTFTPPAQRGEQNRREINYKTTKAVRGLDGSISGSLLHAWSLLPWLPVGFSWVFTLVGKQAEKVTLLRHTRVTTGSWELGNRK